MNNRKSKLHYVDRFDLHVTIPEDEFHPQSGSKLPHHCEMMMYKLSDKESSEFEYTLVDTMNIHDQKDKRNFLFKIATWMGASILSKSVSKPLKWKYAKEMLDHMQEVQAVYETIERLGIELNMTPAQMVNFMKKKLHQADAGGKEES